MAMDVQLHSYAFFLPCLIFTISFFSAESHRHREATNHSACNQTYNYGNINNMAYPFWGKNRPLYCGGGSQFKLTCRNNTTSITVGQQDFMVVSISPEFHSMRLVQTALSVSYPWNFTNTSLDPALFHYDNLTIQTLYVFYKCPLMFQAQATSLAKVVLLSSPSKMRRRNCKSGVADLHNALRPDVGRSNLD